MLACAADDHRVHVYVEQMLGEKLQVWEIALHKFLLIFICMNPLSLRADPDIAVGSVSWLVFGSLQVRFPGPAPFISCQLLVKS